MHKPEHITHTRNVSWWWLSFSDESKSTVCRALGVVIVQADCVHAAVIESHRLGINPGGEILGYCIPATMLTAAENRNRLLSPGDARELAAAMSRNKGQSAVDGSEFCLQNVQRV